jgi:molecular chaperone GrpE
MSDTPPPVRPPGPAGDAAAPLTPEAVERVLADFRAWLGELTEPPLPAVPAPDAPPVDLYTLVAQFTALRHEVNLQTKATRTSLELTGEALQQLGDAVEELRQGPAEDEDVTPLLKALVDMYDNLALALRQVSRQREALEKPLSELAVAPPPGRPPGFWARLFGAAIPESAAASERHQRTAEAATLVRSALDGLIAGYRMSLARVDRVLEEFELDPIPVEGEPFDPELMEVVEVAGDTGRAAGEVVEEVRRGYRRGDAVFRYALVKVAR